MVGEKTENEILGAHEGKDKKKEEELHYGRWMLNRIWANRT